MTYRAVLSALNEKKAIIQRTDDDHWLYEPISEAVDLEFCDTCLSEILKKSNKCQ